MTIRVRQLIQEIEALSVKEREELQASMAAASSGGLPYIPQDEALQAADRILTERAELFRKLAE